MSVQLFKFDDAHLRSMKVGGQNWFASKEVGDALGYIDTPDALKKHVDPEYVSTFAELCKDAPTAVLSRPGDSPGRTRTHLQGMVEHNRDKEKWMTEPGLYELVISSKKPEAKRFRRFVFEEVLPTLRRQGTFTVRNNQMALFNETDLHESIVKFVRGHYPTVPIIAGLGELQTTEALRLASWAKGYTKGQPDLLLPVKSGRFSGLAIELKTPAYFREPAVTQQLFLDKLAAEGYDVLISSSYNELVVHLVRYLDKGGSRKRRRESSESSST
jgi:prophage antirepressor-like protein